MWKPAGANARGGFSPLLPLAPVRVLLYLHGSTTLAIRLARRAGAKPEAKRAVVFLGAVLARVLRAGWAVLHPWSRNCIDAASNIWKPVGVR